MSRIGSEEGVMDVFSVFLLRIVRVIWDLWEIETRTTEIVGEWNTVRDTYFEFEDMDRLCADGDERSNCSEGDKYGSVTDLMTLFEVLRWDCVGYWWLLMGLLLDGCDGVVMTSFMSVLADMRGWEWGGGDMRVWRGIVVETMCVGLCVWERATVEDWANLCDMGGVFGVLEKFEQRRCIVTYMIMVDCIVGEEDTRGHVLHLYWATLVLDLLRSCGVCGGMIEELLDGLVIELLDLEMSIIDVTMVQDSVTCVDVMRRIRWGIRMNYGRSVVVSGYTGVMDSTGGVRDVYEDEGVEGVMMWRGTRGGAVASGDEGGEMIGSDVFWDEGHGVLEDTVTWRREERVWECMLVWMKSRRNGMGLGIGLMLIVEFYGEGLKAVVSVGVMIVVVVESSSVVKLSFVIT
ncbi:hypothetical protein Tco_1569109 [Tanacetum coccineum]